MSRLNHIPPASKPVVLDGRDYLILPSGAVYMRQESRWSKDLVWRQLDPKHNRKRIAEVLEVLS